VKNVLEIGWQMPTTGTSHGLASGGYLYPVWRTEDGKETRVIGSIEELKAAVQESVAIGFMKVNPLDGFVPNDFSDPITIKLTYTNTVLMI
jgi:hypothetical protein